MIGMTAETEKKKAGGVKPPLQGILMVGKTQGLSGYSTEKVVARHGVVFPAESEACASKR